MRDQRAGLSMHDEMRDVRLPDWGFWSRFNEDKPDNQRGLSSGIYHKGKRDERKADADIWICIRCRCPSSQPHQHQHCDQCPTDRPEWLHVPHQAPEEPTRKINEADCDYLDGFIKQLPAIHRQVIRQAYYLGQRTDIQDKDAAVRALLDLMHENRRTIDKVQLMRRMRWVE